MIVSMLDAHFRSWEILDPRTLKAPSADTVQFSTEMGGRVGRLLLALDGSPDVHSLV